MGLPFDVFMTAGADVISVAEPTDELIALSPDSGENARAFLAQHAPDLLIWVDGPVHPRLLFETQRAGIASIHLLLAQKPARMDSLFAWPPLKRKLMNGFDRILVAFDHSARKLATQRIDQKKTEVIGAMSHAQKELDIDEDLVSGLNQSLGTRPVWFASGVNASELPQVLQAHRDILRRSHRSVLALAPVENASTENTRAQIQARFALQELGAETTIDNGTQVVLIAPEDRSIWHRISPTSFIGQADEPASSVDPFDAAALGSAIIFSAPAHKYHARYNVLQEANAAVQISNLDALGEQVVELLSPEIAARYAHAAWDVATTGAQALERICLTVQDILDASESAQ